MDNLRFVDLAEARAARGVRMVVAGVLPSPWSEAAKAVFRVKELPVLAVRFVRGAPEIAAWTGTHNVPVVFHDDEPPRTGWAEILALAERLGGRRSLVPDEDRVPLHGMAHELLGEDGLAWCGRLLMIHASLTSEGRRSWPLPVAQYLAAKYGYAPDRIEAARRRCREVLALFERQLAGQPTLFGDTLTALDLQLAVTLTTAVGAPRAECPAMVELVRPAFDVLHEELAPYLPASLVAHRRRIFDQHLPGPIVI
jgi:glutathione S-transferase